MYEGALVQFLGRETSENEQITRSPTGVTIENICNLSMAIITEILWEVGTNLLVGERDAIFPPVKDSVIFFIIN